MYIPLDPLDFDVYRTLIINRRIFIRSLISGKTEQEPGVSSTLNAITNYGQPKKRSYSNQAIVNGIYSGDADTFNYIYSVSYKPIERLIQKDKGLIADAQDIYHTALMHLMQVVGNGNFVLNTSIETYLYTIAKNLWSKNFNKKHLKQPFNPDPDNLNVLDDAQKSRKQKRSRKPIVISYDNKEDNYDLEKVGTIFNEEMVNDVYPDDYEVINICLGYFSEVCQKLIREYYFSKQDWKHVAKELGYKNEETAKQQSYKCKSGFLQNIKKGKIQIDEKLVNPIYLTKIQGRKYLGVSGKTINHLLKSDQIQSVIVNGKKQFTQDNLNLYIENTIRDFAFCNKNIIKFDRLNQKYYPFLYLTLYPIIHQNRSWIYLYLEGWGKVRFSWKEFNKYFSIADEVQKLAFKFNIFI